MQGLVTDDGLSCRGLPSGHILMIQSTAIATETALGEPMDMWPTGVSGLEVRLRTAAKEAGRTPLPLQCADQACTAPDR